jgi:hypothetical protein
MRNQRKMGEKRMKQRNVLTRMTLQQQVLHKERRKQSVRRQE